MNEDEGQLWPLFSPMGHVYSSHRLGFAAIADNSTTELTTELISYLCYVSTAVRPQLCSMLSSLGDQACWIRYYLEQFLVIVTAGEEPGNHVLALKTYTPE